jgi:hypothetical protein
MAASYRSSSYSLGVKVNEAELFFNPARSAQKGEYSFLTSDAINSYGIENGWAKTDPDTEPPKLLQTLQTGIRVPSFP